MITDIKARHTLGILFSITTWHVVRVSVCRAHCVYHVPCDIIECELLTGTTETQN